MRFEQLEMYYGSYEGVHVIPTLELGISAPLAPECSVVRIVAYPEY